MFKSILFPISSPLWHESDRACTATFHTPGASSQSARQCMPPALTPLASIVNTPVPIPSRFVILSMDVILTVNARLDVIS